MMMISILMMCAGSLAIAVMPTYANIGTAAPVLLLLARMVHRMGLGQGVMVLVLGGLAVLLPVVLSGIGRVASAPSPRVSAHKAPNLLRSPHVWSIALPFAFGSGHIKSISVIEYEAITAGMIRAFCPRKFSTGMSSKHFCFTFFSCRRTGRREMPVV